MDKPGSLEIEIVCSNRNTEFLKRKLPGNFGGGERSPTIQFYKSK